MYVVINIDPGSTLNELMSFMTQRAITFSVTDQLSRLCDRNGDRRESSSQTGDSHDHPSSKKRRLQPQPAYTEECISPCSSATLSEPTDTLIPASKKDNDNITTNWNSKESTILRNLIKNEMEKTISRPAVKEEHEEASVEDDGTDFMQNQLMQALFPKNIGFNPLVNLDDNDSVEGDASSLAILDGSPASAIRYKPAYASTKRGVCQVCNREVSLITTHRRRHAITHLGFKTLKCALCHKFFSRQDLATGHYKKDHPNDEFSPFVDTMSEDDERQLVMMLELCFPEENALRKRVKEDKKAVE